MGPKQFRVLLPVWLSLLSLGLLVLFLWTKLQLSLVRYFDADELAYLHWAHNLFAGRRPYVDFFSYVPPGFLFFLAPLFWLGAGSTPLLAGRMLAFGTFVGLCGAVALLLWEMRRSLALALIAAIILAFLPLPADKFLEIRPDNLATLLGLIGLICQIGWMKGNNRLAFWAGFFYGASLLVLPKMLPQVVLSIVVAVILGKQFPLGWFLVGLSVPLALAGLWLLYLGDVSQVFYSLVKLPLEVNRLGEVFVMQPYHFFYPNAVFYGQGGYSLGLVVNHALWIFGLGVGVGRLLTPFLPKGRSGVWPELLLAGSLFINVILYIYVYPMRHSQYLIPIAVLVAFYAADGLGLVIDYLRRSWLRQLMLTVVVVSGAGVAFGTFMAVNQPKFAWTNAAELKTLKQVLVTVPQSEYVLDFSGLTLYYPDPYYVCCLPFGQYRPYLSRPLPSLRQALADTGTRYIYRGKLGRIETLSEADYAYIAKHFKPSAAVEDLLVRQAP